MKSPCSEAERQSGAFMVELSLLMGCTQSSSLSSKKCATTYTLGANHTYKKFDFPVGFGFYFNLLMDWLVIARTSCAFYAKLFMWLSGFWRADSDSLLHFCSSRHRPWARGLHFSLVDSWVRVFLSSFSSVYTYTPVRLIRIISVVNDQSSNLAILWIQYEKIRCLMIAVVWEGLS